MENLSKMDTWLDVILSPEKPKSDITLVSFRRYYNRASEHTRKQGQEWYRHANIICRQYARKYKKPVKMVAGLLAVLSQRQSWSRNLELLKTVLEGRHPDTLLTVAEKAYKILQGENPENVVKGPKITAFYHAILGDMTQVVLDSWMLKIAGIPRPTTKQYETLAQKLRQEAREANEQPAIYQAIIWCEIRGKEN
jgi:hypothetical protein